MLGLVTAMAACTQQSQTFLTSRSGKAYRVLAFGPVQGKGWTGVMIKYDAPSEDPRALRESADDLMQMLVKPADDRHADSIIVSADFAPEGRSGFVTKTRGYVDVYRRAAKGWEHVEHEGR